MHEQKIFLNKINGKMQNTSSFGHVIEKKIGMETSKTEESIMSVGNCSFQL